MEHFKIIRMLIILIARTYLFSVACLTLWVLIPLVLMWTPTAVISGSMEPTIMTGDVLSAQKVTTSQVYSGVIKAGMIVLASDPMNPDTLFTHRVIEIRPDRSMITRGDANATADPIALPPENVRGIERLRIPFIGHPVQAVYSGDMRKLAVIAFSLIMSLVILSQSKKAEDQVTSQIELASEINESKVMNKPNILAPRLQIGSFGFVSVAASVILAFAFITLTSAASAKFTGHYAQANNSWTASESFPIKNNQQVARCGTAVYTSPPGTTLTCSISSISGKTSSHVLKIMGIGALTQWSVTTDWSNVAGWLKSRASGTGVADTGDILIQKGYQIKGQHKSSSSSDVFTVQVTTK